MRVVLTFFILALFTGVIHAQEIGAVPGLEREDTQLLEERLPTSSKGFVARALFTTEVLDHEPVDNVVSLSDSYDRINFFTELRSMRGQTVIHRWEYDGKVVAEVKFEIKGDRWRVHSRKSLKPDQLGVWTVVITDGTGWPLKATIFEYITGDTNLASPEEVR